LPSTDFDIVFVGHACRDEVVPFDAKPYRQTGSAVLCGAAVAGRIGATAAIITRMNPADDDLLQPLRETGIKVFVVAADVTAFARVVHPSPSVDDRRLFVVRDPGPFSMKDIPSGLKARVLHLAGISDHEFTVGFMRELKKAGFSLSVDMQSFVRVIGPDREIVFSDVPAKKDIVAMTDVVKLDVVEADILTGTRDLKEAARIITGWGAREVLITEKQGATLAADGKVFHEAFTNRSQVGRTGRGDTTISAYLCRRQTHSPEESLRFAAALVSIKMEKAGPFSGTLTDVERRMRHPT